jgi:hypothetical protein
VVLSDDIEVFCQMTRVGNVRVFRPLVLRTNGCLPGLSLVTEGNHQTRSISCIRIEPAGGGCYPQLFLIFFLLSVLASSR